MGFSPNELNVARQGLLDRVIEYFVNREGVEALYIQGSVAAGSTDEFSDIDCRVVIKPEVYEQYTSERFSAPQYWGEWLYNEWTSNVWVCVSHFKPFNKIDVLYFKPEHLQSSPWYLLPTQVIYDPKNLVQQVIAASQEMEFFWTLVSLIGLSVRD
jgi:predicted nucleotidyltransferase